MANATKQKQAQRRREREIERLRQAVIKPSCEDGIHLIEVDTLTCIRCGEEM